MNKKILPLLSITAVSLISLFAFQNCEQQSKISVVDPNSANNTATTSGNTSTDSAIPALSEASDYVCSALGTITVQSETSGLKCELRYVDQSSSLSVTEKNALSVRQYFDDSLAAVSKSPSTIFLNDVNVPTRSFDTGFLTASGDYLLDNSGARLIEYFGLKMDSVLHLSANDEEGDYELATISDDGTIMQYKDASGNWTDLILNDGSHAPRMGCASKLITMKRDTRLPIRILYNQGPKVNIANVLMWRKITGTGTAAANYNKYCGIESNSDFWKPGSTSPGPNVQDLLTMSWSIVKPANFALPDNELNPCAFSTQTLISTFDLISYQSKTANLKLTLTEPALLNVNLYVIHIDGSKTVANTLSLSQDSVFSLNFASLDSSKSYSIELLMTVPAKSLKLRKEYLLKFSN